MLARSLELKEPYKKCCLAAASALLALVLLISFVNFAQGQPGQPPSPPVSPENNENTNDNTPFMDWQDASGIVDNYHIQIDNDSNYSSPNVDNDNVGSVSECAVLDENQLPDGVYYWRVRAENADGYGPWSDNWTFVVNTQQYLWVQTTQSDFQQGTLENVIATSGDNVRLNDNELSTDENTIALYHFNEGTGDTVYDETANNNDGTITTATWTTGKFDNGLYFDEGWDDYVEVPDSTSLSPTGGLTELTVECWYYPESNARTEELVSKFTNPDLGWHIQTQTGTGDNIKFYVWVGFGGGAAYGYPVSDVALINQWTHLALVYASNPSGGHNLIAYVNGVLKDNQYNLGWGNIANTSDNLFIGADHGTGGWAWGTIDEVRIENRALTTSEIAADAAPGYKSSGTLTSVVKDAGGDAWWDIIEWDNTTPAGTSLTMEARSSGDNSTWSAWTSVNKGDNLSWENRYFQYRATFTGGSDTPVLSEVRVNYTVLPTLPGKPTLSSPSDGTTTNDNTPTFTWTAGSSATSHRLVIDNNPNFADGENTYDNANLGGSATSCTIENELPDDNYSWKVIAINSSGENESDNWTFRVDTLAPAAPTMTYPDNNENTNDNTPTFRWTIPPENSLPLTYRLQIYKEPGVDDNTIALYRLNESSGTNVPDEMGNDDGTLQGTEGTDWDWIDNGKFGNALQFYNSGSGYITVPDSSRFSPPGDLPELTVEFWYWSGPADETDALFDKYKEYATPTYHGWFIDEQAATTSTKFKLFMQVGTGSGYRNYWVDDVANEEEWVHIAMVWDGSELYMFVNGENKTGGTYGGSGSGNIDNTTQVLYIGCKDAGWYPIDGAIDEVRIENRALTAAEILADASAYYDNVNITENQHELPAENALSDGMCYWRVMATDNAGNNGNWSDNWIFRVDTLAPAAPTMTYPDNDENINDNTPNLDWTAPSENSYPLTYDVWVDNNSGFSSPEVTATGITDENYQLTSELQDNLYYWRVRATDNAGNVGDNSERTFRVDTLAPAAPTMTYPDNNENTNDNTPTFRWTVPESSPLTYRLQIDNELGTDDNTLALYHFNEGSGTAVSDSSNNGNDGTIGGTEETNWRWWVDNGKFDDALHIIDGTGKVTVPDSPSLNSEGGFDELTIEFWYYDQDVNAANEVVAKFDWGGGKGWFVRDDGVATNPNKFDLYVWMGFVTAGSYGWVIDNAGNAGEWVHIAAVYAPDGPGHKMTVYANGVEIGSKSNTGWDGLDNTTNDLIMGNGNGVVDEVRIENRALTAAEIAADASAYFYDNANITENQHELPAESALSDGIHYWRVRAIDNAGNDSDWSDNWIFRVDTLAPAAPTLVSPDNGAQTADSTPTLSWNAVDDNSLPVTYDLQVDDNADFSSPTENVSGLTDNSYTTSSLAEDTWYWRVRAEDNAGNTGNWSSRLFTVDTTAQAAPTLTAPANGASTIDTTPTFDWGSVSGAASYTLQYATDSGFTQNLTTISTSATNYTPTSALTDGMWYWRVRTIDAAGNIGGWSNTWSFTIDTATPTVTISPTLGATPTATGWILTTANSSIEISGSVGDATGVTVRINGEVVPVIGGSFSKTVNLVVGTNTFTISITDVAGNTTTRTLSVIRTAAVTPPAAAPAISPELAVFVGVLVAVIIVLMVFVKMVLVKKR